MTTGRSINTQEAPLYPSPLWIIALFIALSELTAGIAAITTDGTTRMIFTLFAVIFPIGVLLVFIWLLVRHPANLYSPWQYTDGVEIDVYVDALSRQRRATSLVYSHAASEAIEKTAADAGATSSEPSASKAYFEETFERLVKESSVTVDCSAYREGEAAQIPVTEETTAADLLDAIYFEIAHAVRPFTYGSSWLIARNGKLFTEIGTQWAERNSLERDERTLWEVGIQPGSALKVLPAPSSS